MSQEVKTITLVLVALVCGIAAVVSSREAPEITELDVVGTKFVDVDPLEVTRLKVVRFDSDKGQQQPFEVAKSGERFTIPSHENYPADAKDRIKDSVNLLNGSDILAIASEAKESHEDFGVLDPEDDSLGQGAVGVGMRVTMGAGGDEPLADFIVGKEVKDQENQHYVRKAGKNQVYVIQVDPDKLSTKFEDWVERDFLKFNPLDMEKVGIDNYSLRKEERVDLFRGQVNVVLAQDWNSKVELDYKDSEWSLTKFETFDDQKNPSEVKLTDSEELNKEKLNAMKDALDDLEIVDVRRKPKDFQANWQELQKENPKVLESLQDVLVSLQQRGFYVLPPQGPDQGPLFLSDNGEINVGMKDGVKYVLRFGNTAGAGQTDDKKGDDQAAGDEEAAADGAGDDEAQQGADVLRYLLVTAKFDESLLEKPELKEVPPEEPPADEPPADEPPADEPPADEPPADEPPADEPPADEPPADEPPAEDPPAEQPDAPKESSPPADDATKPAPDDAAPSEAGKDNPGESEQPCDGEETAAEETADDETTDAADDAPVADQPTPDAPAPGKPTDDKPAPDVPAASGGDDKTPADDAAKDEEAEKKQKLEEWKKNRDDVIQENERLQKEYDDKVTAGKKHVDELNERFEAWYYVISNETYNKIRLSRDDIIKEKEKEDSDDPAKNALDANAARQQEIDDLLNANKTSIDKFNELKDALPAEE